MTFSPETYEAIRAGARRSAARVVPAVCEIVRPATVIDVGCGEGWFAREFARQPGCEVVVAVDREVEPGDSDGVSFVRDTLPRSATGTRLAASFVRRLDLAVCLEVAEHLPAADAGELVLALCELSDIVLFSAAVPGQGGIGHLNEQWPAYWADLFRRHDRVANEDLRAVLWDDVDVESWYRQNVLLYAPVAWMDERAIPYGEPYAVVHPDLFAARVRERDEAWARLREEGVAP